MKPKVSIIVPIYNVESYLDRCIQSLLNQTLKEIEIILVDDGSPDNCPAMCDEYAKQDNRIKVIHKKNAGLGYARNSGLEMATGEYVAFVDSDDFVDINMYHALYERAKRDNLDTCYCGFVRHYATGKNENKTEVRTYTRFTGRKGVDSFLLDMVGPEPSYHSDVKYMMCVWKAIYSKMLIDKYNIRFCSERQFVSEDIIFHLDYLPKALNVGFIPDCFYYYCVNGTATLSNTYSREKFERSKIFLTEVKRKLHLLFPTDVFQNHFYRLCFLYLRTSFAKELESDVVKKYRLKKKCIREFIDDSFFSSMFKCYPYMNMPLKHSLMFVLMKYKCYNVIAFLFHRNFRCK